MPEEFRAGTLKIIVIDNGSQYTHRIYRTLQDLKVETKIVPNSASFEEIKNADALAFSGSGGLVSQGASMGNCPVYLEKFSKPILGMCAGHQLIGEFFGGKVRSASESLSGTPEFGKTEIIIDKHGDLFRGLPQKFFVWESHNDEVSEISPELELLAHSDTCAFEAIKHVSRPIYGVQFHPEVQHSQYGKEIYANFVRIAKTYK